MWGNENSHSLSWDTALKALSYMLLSLSHVSANGKLGQWIIQLIYLTLVPCDWGLWYS